MKLLFCPVCRDVHGLIEETWRTCVCGQSGGQYNADGMTATIGGEARVFGVGNFPFLDPLFIYLDNETKRKVRQKFYGQPDTDAWWGEYPGDVQIFRIADASGPRLKVRVVPAGQMNEVHIRDKRLYTIDGEMHRKMVLVPRNVHFKAKTRWCQNEGKSNEHVRRGSPSRGSSKHRKDQAPPEA